MAVERALRRAGRARRVDEQRGRVRASSRRARSAARRRRAAARRSRSTSTSGTSSPSSAIRSSGSPSPSTTRTSASRSRVSSASGPKRMLSGTAIAPSLAVATCATRRLGPLREDDPDAVARPDPEPAQSVGEPVRVVRELPERDRAGDLAPVGDEDRGVVPRLPLAHLDAEVEGRRQLPAERRREAPRTSGRSTRQAPAHRPLERREVDPCRADELLDGDRLDVRVRPLARAGRGRRSGSRRRPGRSPRRRRP